MRVSVKNLKAFIDSKGSKSGKKEALKNRDFKNIFSFTVRNNFQDIKFYSTVEWDVL